jgi:HAD superfamily phosphatase
MSVPAVIVFDMDGVLVDVSESYRETIRATVRHFTGKEITRELVQDYKNAGGWNNDWALTQRIVLDIAGLEIPYNQIVREFQRIFIGEQNDGLILRERWLPESGLLDRLSAKYDLAIFTGRPRDEADFTLSRFVPAVHWAAIIADDDVSNAKPAPDGLLAIAQRCPQSPLWYIGDTVDDARSARAAGVRFIGIASTGNPRCAELASLLQSEQAIAVLDSVNELERVL